MSDAFASGKVQHTKDTAAAYDLGLAIGRLQRGVAQVVQTFTKGFQQGLAGLSDLTPEQRERARERLAVLRYEQRIQRERRIGLDYVHDQAARVRRELGLEDLP